MCHDPTNPDNGDLISRRRSGESVIARALEKADDASVTIVAVGYATNLHALLQNTRMRRLVETKVKSLVWMGGGNPRSDDEWNFRAPPPSRATYSSDAPSARTTPLSSTQSCAHAHATRPKP